MSNEIDSNHCLELNSYISIRSRSCCVQSNCDSVHGIIVEKIVNFVFIRFGFQSEMLTNFLTGCSNLYFSKRFVFLYNVVCCRDVVLLFFMLILDKNSEHGIQPKSQYFLECLSSGLNHRAK